MTMHEIARAELLARIDASAEDARLYARRYGRSHHLTRRAAALTLRMIAEYRARFAH